MPFRQRMPFRQGAAQGERMGKYDNIEPERLEADLRRFAELILRLDEEDGLLTSPSDLLTILGELRQKLFAYEVRSSHLLTKEDSAGSSAKDAPDRESETESESLRVVREARRRQREMMREWMSSPDEEDGDGG